MIYQLSVLAQILLFDDKTSNDHLFTVKFANWFKNWKVFLQTSNDSYFFFFYVVPSTEETSFSTTFYVLYFNHNYKIFKWESGEQFVNILVFFN